MYYPIYVLYQILLFHILLAYYIYQTQQVSLQYYEYFIFPFLFNLKVIVCNKWLYAIKLNKKE